MKEKIDDTDKLLLKKLRENCKAPMREIAKDLHIHPNTVLQRVKKLEKNDVIRGYQAKIDYRKLNYDVHAVVMIKIRKSGLEKENLLMAVRKMPEIEALYAVTGGADCIAMVHAKNRDHLVRVLKDIQNQKEVLRTISHIILVSYKRPEDFNPLINI